MEPGNTAGSQAPSQCPRMEGQRRSNWTPVGRHLDDPRVGNASPETPAPSTHNAGARPRTPRRPPPSRRAAPAPPARRLPIRRGARRAEEAPAVAVRAARGWAARRGRGACVLPAVSLWGPARVAHVTCGDPTGGPPGPQCARTGREGTSERSARGGAGRVGGSWESGAAGGPSAG